jgi:hypothetical protein
LDGVGCGGGNVAEDDRDGGAVEATAVGVGDIGEGDAVEAQAARDIGGPGRDGAAGAMPPPPNVAAIE